MATAGKILMFPVGDWTSGNDYGFLDIVYFGGSSYIAKTDIVNSTVDPATDTTNWQILARGYLADTLSGINGIDTSGLIGTAGGTVSSQTLIDKIADMVADKLILKTAISNQQVNDTTKVTGSALAYSMGQSIDTLNSNLDETNIKIGGNNCLVIADSYNTWIDTFENIYDGNVYRSVLGGAGFVGAGQGKTFGDLLADSTSIVPNANIIDTIIVQGFLNDDNQSRSDIVNAGNTFITNCRSMYPNAKIHFVNAGWSKDVSQQYRLVTVVSPAISAIAEGGTLGGVYHHNVQHMAHYYPYFIDTVHQNSSGYQHLAIAIFNSINGKEYSCPYLVANSVLTATSNATGLSGSISNVMQGKHILINPFEITFTCNLARNINQTLDILTLSGGFVIGNGAGGYIQMQGSLNYNQCDIYIENGVLTFVSPIALTVGTSYTLRSRGGTVPYFKG